MFSNSKGTTPIEIDKKKGERRKKDKVKGICMVAVVTAAHT